MKKLIIVALLGMVFGCGGQNQFETKDEMLRRVFYEQSDKFTRCMTKSLDYQLRGQSDSSQMYSDSAHMAYYAERLMIRELYGQ